MWPLGWCVHPTIEIRVCADQPVARARIFVDLSLTSVGPSCITIGTLSFRKICIAAPPFFQKSSEVIWVRF